MTPTAGTTRDVIEVHLDLGGLPVTVADTAGLRENAEGIEAEGIARARARAEAADLRLMVHDARDWRGPVAVAQDEKTITVVNKCDLRPIDGCGSDID